ncbi:MAG: 4-hydroxybenzoate octaprenyltransferase [Magnetococcales bacterium]|nr:4-hydroxybenzoate octaprenyltransferase [Magnetococcales bacterium]
MDTSIVRESLRLMRVDRPVGTWLLLWPGLWSLLAASQDMPHWKLWIIMVLGTFIMRSAGCVANDLTDRNIDPYVTRTRSRPLAIKSLSISYAVILLVALMLVALLLAMQLNFFSFLLCFPAAFLALSYPWTKRVIHAPQLYLGISFGWSVIVAWSAVQNSLAWPAWLLFFATIFWATGYDTIYGMIDRKDDRKIGVKSTALYFGDRVWGAVGCFYFFMIILLCVTGFLLNYSIIYYIFIGVAQLHLAQQILDGQKLPDDQLLPIFIRNQWTGFYIFLGFVFEKFA